jgi:hypothetical protein
MPVAGAAAERAPGSRRWPEVGKTEDARGVQKARMMQPGIAGSIKAGSESAAPQWPARAARGPGAECPADSDPVGRQLRILRAARIGIK